MLLFYCCSQANLIIVLFNLWRLKKIDIEFMRVLQLRVNVIPIIAKADTMTTGELLDFKKQGNPDFSLFNVFQILNTLIEEKIQIYQLPEGKDIQEQKDPFQLFPPYAVIGSKNFVCVICI